MQAEGGRVGVREWDLESPLLGAGQEPGELLVGRAVADAEGPAFGLGGAFELRGGGFGGGGGVLDGVGGEAESELAADGDLTEQWGVVADGGVFAVGVGPAGLFDEVAPVRAGGGEDEQHGPAGVVRVQTPQDALVGGCVRDAVHDGAVHGVRAGQQHPALLAQGVDSDAG